MSLIVGTILAFMFLEWPWRGLVVLGLFLVEGVEIWLWLKLRKMPSSTGAEAMVGAHGRAVTDCNPEGQVRVKGQLWRVRCPMGVRAGDHITVTALRGLELEVTKRALGVSSDPAARKDPDRSS
jgi:membrane protein implicated in regulation of membrane protease activity